MKNNKIDLIWNISLMCPWRCSFCCTDAEYVTPHSGTAHSPLSWRPDHTIDSHEHNILSQLHDYGFILDGFDYELIKRQAAGSEMNIKHKLNIIDKIDIPNIKLDIAGGDPLICYENFIVASHASKKFGRSNLSVTTTGKAMSKYNPSHIAEYFGKLEFTYDTADLNPRDRQPNYDKSNLASAKRLSKLGVSTRAQTPLHNLNNTKKLITKIYLDLREANIDTILLMRLFPVGRAQNIEPHIKISKSEYRHAIEEYKNLENKYTKPKIAVQCALKGLTQKDTLKNPCDAGTSSFGINPYGQLLLCAWANKAKCKPMDRSFIVGDLAQSPLSRLTNSPHFKEYLSKSDSNFGHCKVFSYINSPKQDESALLSKHDLHAL